MAEAMAHGKPVVATAYSGNMDYMDRDSAFLVAHRRVHVRDRLTPLRFFDRTMTWAAPIEESAVEALRECEARSLLRAERAGRGREKVRSLLDPGAIGRQMRRLLE